MKAISEHGGYRDLKSFQMAAIVFDGTVFFCNRCIDRRSRTHDQMVQAARSGKQNIVEGSAASGTSKKTDRTYVESTPEVAANTLICLIHRANYLLDRQLRALERAFLEDGGFTENLFRARCEARQAHSS